ncbi:MAG: type pilus assembly protein PilN [Frankiales bacterium]|nr:type pilus assembly protein PilN [Frankiales bacterium]
MTTPTLTTTQLAALPRVNLLPPEIAERRRARLVQVGMGAAFAASVVVIGAVYMLAHQGATNAKSDLEAAQTLNTSLKAQVTKFDGDQAKRADLISQQGLLTTAMGREIQWSHFMNDLSLRIPENVWVKHITFTETAVPGGVAPPANSAALPDAGLGKITFEGVAYTHDDVATWLDSLAREKGYANPYFTTSVTAFIGPTAVVNHSSSVTLTDAALSGRYTQPAGS